MKINNKKMKTIMITIALIIVYILGGSAIKLPSYHDKDGQECDRTIYGFQIFTECQSYTTASIGGEKYIDRISSNNKNVHAVNHVNIIEQLQRYYKYYTDSIKDYVYVVLKELLDLIIQTDNYYSIF